MKNRFFDSIVNISVILSVMGLNIILLTVLLIVSGDLNLLWWMIAIIIICAGVVLLSARSLFTVVEVNESGVYYFCFGKQYRHFEWQQVEKVFACPLYWQTGLCFVQPKTGQRFALRVNPHKLMVLTHYCPDEHLKKDIDKSFRTAPVYNPFVRLFNKIAAFFRRLFKKT